MIYYLRWQYDKRRSHCLLHVFIGHHFTSIGKKWSPFGDINKWIRWHHLIHFFNGNQQTRVLDFIVIISLLIKHHYPVSCYASCFLLYSPPVCLYLHLPPFIIWSHIQIFTVDVCRENSLSHCVKFWINSLNYITLFSIFIDINEYVSGIKKKVKSTI